MLVIAVWVGRVGGGAVMGGLIGLEGYINKLFMGGAFLSQPVTTKKTNKYQHAKIRVVTCEMQGILLST